jgi:hypothetical protein
MIFFRRTTIMDKIEKIGREIKEFSPSELAAFCKWFHDFDAEAWDRQIEEDVQAGKLDALAKGALFSSIKY